MLVGPPISGALYGRFGARAPYLFGIITTVADLICRLLLVDRKEALRWGVDTRAEETARAAEFTADAEVELASVHSSRHSITPSQHDGTTGVSSSVSVVVRTEVRMPEATGSPEASTSSGAPLQNVSTKHSNTQPEAQMSEFKVVAALCHSPRALSAMSTILIYAYILQFLANIFPKTNRHILDFVELHLGHRSRQCLFISKRYGISTRRRSALFSSAL
jgi:MFS transporter, DHA1 family, solute carrier family 18 (vesicular amine transporter), member 1/2